jgi:hypothetical protein
MIEYIILAVIIYLLGIIFTTKKQTNDIPSIRDDNTRRRKN